MTNGLQIAQRPRCRRISSIQSTRRIARTPNKFGPRRRRPARVSHPVYDGPAAHREAIGDEALNEYLRTFSGRAGVLGAIV